MADISKIKVPNSAGTLVEYTLKDAAARQAIADLTSNIMRFVGYTTTAITDGSTTKTITINGASHTAASGDVVIYDPDGKKDGNEQEFIFDGTAWREFGSTTALKALAFKDSATGTFTCVEPTGTVTNNLKYAKVTSGSVAGVMTGGTVDTTGDKIEVPVTIKSPTAFTYSGATKGADKTTNIHAVATGAAITPSGAVTVPTGVKITTSGKALSGITATTRYLRTKQVYVCDHENVQTASRLTSAGSVTAGTDVSFSAGTLPSLTTSVSGETLTFNYSQGTLPSATGGKATLVTLPTFSDVGNLAVRNNTPITVLEGSFARAGDKEADPDLPVITALTPTEIDCITGIEASGTKTAYTSYTLSQPTITLSSPATAGTGDVTITSQTWSNTNKSGSLLYKGAVEIPYTIIPTTASAEITVSHTDTPVSGSASVNTTTATHTVTVS